jgi:type I restriction enzyme, S subunit
LESKQEIIFKKLFEIPMKNGLFKPTKVRGSGTKMINMGEIFAIDRIFDVPMELVPLTDIEEKNAIIEKNDLIFARSSLAEGAGKCSIFLGDEKTTFESHIIRVRINQKIANPKFYYYYFNSDLGKNLVYTITEKTAASGIRGSDLADLPVPFFSKSIQDDVVSRLEILDIKIENLQKQNKILEQISHIIFKSWFIDFDGVTEWDYSELGYIPKGWNVTTLDNFLEVIKGVSYRSVDLIPSNKALVTLKSIKRNGGYTERGLKSFNGKYKDSHIVHENDIVIAQTDLTQSADVIGKPALIRNSKDFDILIASLDLGIIKLKNNDLPKSYLYHMFMSDEFQNHIYGYTSGTNVLHLAKEGVPNYNFIRPPENILKKFDKHVLPTFKKITDNIYEIDTLTKIRDTLVIKFVSGEI